MFLVSFPHSIIGDNGTMKFYSYVNHYVKADLSYMDDMKIGITYKNCNANGGKENERF